MNRARRALAVSAAVGVVMLGPVPAAQAEMDYSSFFWQRDLEGAGWAACEKPITWSLDAGGLTSRQTQREIARLDQAWDVWSEASGVAVRFVGTESLVFDPGTNGLRRADGAPQPDRHVYLAFKTGRQVPIMTRGVVGLAMPSVVLLPAREIVAGMAIIRRGFVLDERKEDPNHVLHVYLHELGHIVGLGHAGRQDNVMYPTLDHMTFLGSGDRAGAKAFTKECVRWTGSTVVTVTQWRE